MPFLPQHDLSTQAVDLGQGPSVQRAGDAWDAVANVGNKIHNFASQLAEKRKQAEVSSYVNTSSNDFERFVSDKETELQSKFTGDPTGYSSAMNEAINDWSAQKADSAPNSDAKNIWEERFSNFSNAVGMKSNAWENASRVKYQVGQMDDSVTKDAQHLANKPDPALAAQFITNTSQMVNDGVGLYYDKTEASDRMKKYGASTAKALMDGIEANKQYGVGLSIFNGKDPNSKIILDHMTPDQIGSYKDRLIRLQKAEAEVSQHTLNLKADDVKTAYMDGMKVPDDAFNALVEQSKTMKPADRAVFVDNLNMSRHYGTLLNQMKTLPVEDMQKFTTYKADHGQDIFNLASRQKMADEFQKTATKIVDQRKNQAPDFWVSNDQTVKLSSMQAMDVKNPAAMDAYSKTITAKKLADKSSSTQVLTTDMSKHYSTLIKATNSEAANSVAESLQQGFGRDYGNVVNDMVKNQHLTEDYAMAMHVQDPDSRKALFENLINKKKIEIAYDGRADKSKSEENALFSDPKVMGLKQAIIANSGSTKDLWVTNGIDSLLKNEYKANRVNGMNESDSLKSAVKKVIANNFDVATSGKSSIPLMGKYKGMKDDVEGFMDDAVGTHILNKLDLVVPQSYADFGQKAGKSQEEMRSRYLTELSQTGKWILNDAQNGLKLVRPQGNDKISTPMDKNGRPFEVKFDDMKNFMATMEVARQKEIDKLRGL